MGSLARMCQDITTHLQPQQLPQPQWVGTNKLLHIYQRSDRAWEIFPNAPSMANLPVLHQVLYDHWQQRGAWILSQRSAMDFCQLWDPLSVAELQPKTCTGNY